MDEYDSGTRDSLENDFPLELELEEPISKPKQNNEVEEPKTSAPQPSPFASSKQQNNKAFAASSQAQAAPKNTSSSPQPTPKNTPSEPQIVFYDMEEKKNDTLRLLFFTIVFGVIGALCFAGISAVYFSIGRRVGILFVAFFATLGARMGTEQLRGNRVRWYAAFTAGGSAIVGKAFLVFMLFHMYPSFTAEDWSNFSDPGKSAAIYFEQSVENALSTDGSDQRTGQEKLDDRFEREYQDSDSAGDDDGWSEEGSDEGEYEDEPLELEFSQVFPKLFDVFDFPLIIAAMFLAFRFSRNES